MGWRLAEEVAWARPERPGPEWWTLLDVAQDASDDTRQGWPGHEYLAARAKASRRTVDRRIKALISAGLIKVARKAAPGRRVVYEIPALHQLPVDNSATCDTEADARQRATSSGQRATETGQRATAMVAHPPSVLPSLPPSDSNGTAFDVAGVESARASPDQDPDSSSPDTRTRDGTEAARRRQADALTEWIREHPEAVVTGTSP